MKSEEEARSALRKLLSPAPVATGLTLAVGSVAVTALAFLAFLAISILHPLSLADHLALIAAGAGVATFLLAAIGGAIAIAAYRLSTQVPVLWAEVILVDDIVRDPVEAFLGGVSLPEEEEFAVDLAEGAHVGILVRLTNLTTYSARSPAVLLVLQSVDLLSSQYDGWSVTPHSPTTTSFQWEGGADYIVHGNWKRDLPALHLQLRPAPGEELAMGVQVVAEGFKASAAGTLHAEA
jgi:hypothetical protein